MNKETVKLIGSSTSVIRRVLRPLLLFLLSVHMFIQVGWHPIRRIYQSKKNCFVDNTECNRCDTYVYIELWTYRKFENIVRLVRKIFGTKNTAHRNSIASRSDFPFIKLKFYILDFIRVLLFWIGDSPETLDRHIPIFNLICLQPDDTRTNCNCFRSMWWKSLSEITSGETINYFIATDWCCASVCCCYAFFF